MKTFKRLLSVIICATLVLGGLPCITVPVNAQSLEYTDLLLDINWTNIDSVGRQTPGSFSCSCFALAYSRTILDNYVHYFYEYNEYGNTEYSVNALWYVGQHNSIVYSSSNEVLRKMYSDLCNGKPVIVYVTGRESSGHYVTVVGFQNIISLDSMSEYNFLIIDPVVNDGHTAVSLGGVGYSLNSYRQVVYDQSNAKVPFSASNNLVCPHNYIASEIPANCTQDGARIYTCSSCGNSYSEPIEAIGHHYVGVKTDATCSVAAHTTYTCSRCNDSYIETADGWSEWSTEYPSGISDDLIEQKTQYSMLEKEYTTSTSDTLDGWTSCGTTYGDWGVVQTTTTKPTESDTLRITNTVQTVWGWRHTCYQDSQGVWQVCDGYSHTCTTNGILQLLDYNPALGVYNYSTYGGQNFGAPACPYNFYYWFRNPSADVYTYSYQVRELVNQFYKWSDKWTEWSDEEIAGNEDCQVKTQTLYRYRIINLKEHEYICTEKEPTFTQKGFIKNTCANCGDTVIEEIPCLTGEVAQWNIALREDFELRFFLEVSDSIANTAKVRLMIGDTAETYNISALDKTEDDYYLLKAKISAAQMNELIIVMVMNGRDVGSTATYTVREYCDTILADEGHSQYHALVKEMLNYGAMAQVYFNYDTENLANDGITDTAATEVPETAEEMTVSDKIIGLGFYGTSLVYRDRIAVRYYFTGDVTDCTFTANGNTYTPVAKDGMHYVEIAGIVPQDLDQQITVTVSNVEGNTLTVSYSPMNYIVRMNQKGSEAVKNLVKALYNYHLAAKALRTTV